MAAIALLPSTTQLLARATVKHTQNYGPISTARGGLFPLSMSAWNVDEYRMMSGWPVAVPGQDVHGQTLVSCDGLVISYREDANQVDTKAVMRWIASQTETYDQVSLKWYAYNGSADSQWITATDFAPTFLTDYEYRVGSERFTVDALNFDSDSHEHMWADLTPVIGGQATYTVLMVVNLHSVFGDTTLPTVGIWDRGLPTGVDSTFTEAVTPFMSVTLRGETLYLETDQTPATKALPISDLLATSAPFYLAFAFGRPYTFLYAGIGPSSMRRVQTFAGRVQNGLAGNVVLGRTNGTITQTADMAVLDLGIYNNQLSTAEVNVEVAKLAAVYGGDK